MNRDPNRDRVSAFEGGSGKTGGPFVRWQEEEVCDRRTSIDSRGGNFEKLLREAGEKLRPLDARAKVVTHFQQAIIEEATTSSTPKPRHVFPFHPRASPYSTFLVKLFFDSFTPPCRGEMSFHPSPNFEFPLFEFGNG